MSVPTLTRQRFNQGVVYPFPYVIAPGTALIFGTTVVNFAIYMTYFWHERALEPSESR